MGVGALELARGGSAYTVSRNDAAEKTVASDGSDAPIECSSVGSVLQWRMFRPSERKTTSSASCVSPRCDREPRIVCV
jgi:hypothetical protein